MRYWIYETRTGAICGVSEQGIGAAGPVLPPALPDGYAVVGADPAVADPVAALFIGDDGQPAPRIARDALPSDGWISIDGADAVPVAQAPADGDHTLKLIGRYAGTIVMTSLATAQAARWSDARAYRDARQTGGCDTPLGRVDTNDAAKLNIVGAASAAAIAKAAGQPFSVDWTMADNSVVTHDADAMIAMGMAVVAWIDACQRAGTAIRDAIEAATTVAAAAATDITAGYPA